MLDGHPLLNLLSTVLIVNYFLSTPLKHLEDLRNIKYFLGRIIIFFFEPTNQKNYSFHPLPLLLPLLTVQFGNTVSAIAWCSLVNPQSVRFFAQWVFVDWWILWGYENIMCHVLVDDLGCFCFHIWRFFLGHLLKLKWHGVIMR